MNEGWWRSWDTKEWCSPVLYLLPSVSLLLRCHYDPSSINEEHSTILRCDTREFWFDYVMFLALKRVGCSIKGSSIFSVTSLYRWRGKMKIYRGSLLFFFLKRVRGRERKRRGTKKKCLYTSVNKNYSLACTMRSNEYGQCQLQV